MLRGGLGMCENCKISEGHLDLMVELINLLVIENQKLKLDITS